MKFKLFLFEIYRRKKSIENDFLKNQEILKDI